MNDILSLSKQERKILDSLSTGNMYKEIARDFNISINTVKKHLKNIYRKLEVPNRLHAVEKLNQSDNNSLNNSVDTPSISITQNLA